MPDDWTRSASVTPRPEVQAADPLKDAPLSDRLGRLVEMIRREAGGQVGGPGELAVTLTLSAVAGWITDTLDRLDADRRARHPEGSPERAGWSVSPYSTAEATAMQKAERDMRNSLILSALHGELGRFVAKTRRNSSREAPP